MNFEEIIDKILYDIKDENDIFIDVSTNNGNYYFNTIYGIFYIEKRENEYYLGQNYGNNKKGVTIKDVDNLYDVFAHFFVNIIGFDDFYNSNISLDMKNKLIKFSQSQNRIEWQNRKEIFDRLSSKLKTELRSFTEWSSIETKDGIIFEKNNEKYFLKINNELLEIQLITRRNDKDFVLVEHKNINCGKQNRVDYRSCIENITQSVFRILSSKEIHYIESKNGKNHEFK